MGDVGDVRMARARQATKARAAGAGWLWLRSGCGRLNVAGMASVNVFQILFFELIRLMHTN